MENFPLMLVGENWQVHVELVAEFIYENCYDTFVSEKTLERKQHGNQYLLQILLLNLCLHAAHKDKGENC